MQQLINKIEQWAEDRNLIKGCTTLDQAMKLFSEFGELADSVAKEDLDGIKDGIGDVFVVMTILYKQQGDCIFDATCNPEEPLFKGANVKTLVVKANKFLFRFIDNEDFYNPSVFAISCLKRIAEQKNLTLQQCVEHAYKEIKDSKGIMHNGTFIKESDDRYKQLVGEKQ